MLEQIIESYFPKIVGYGVDTVWEKGNFKSKLKTLDGNLTILRARAFDIEVEIKNGEHLGNKKRKREIEDWLKNVQITETERGELESEAHRQGFIKHFFGGEQAAKLNSRVCELIEQSRHFGELVLEIRKIRGEALLTTKLIGKAFQENLAKIWKFLVDHRVPSIGIYGLGGVGKTSLAKHINNRLQEETQECVFWVTVSHVVSIKKLQDEIAHIIRLDLSNEHDEEKRSASLNRALSQIKNFVLILDNVWEYIDLEKVGLTCSIEGFRLIITSRSSEVCRQIGCQELIEMKTLHVDEAWSLFCETLGHSTKLAPQVRDIAMSVAKVCDGLPLGIITLARSMRGKTDIHVWRNALLELQNSIIGHTEMADQVFEVLKHSFDCLDPHHQRQGKSIDGYTTIQQCFLYCSLYPEDYKIPREELINKFILEGLVDTTRSMRAQLDQGHSILDKLIDVCLLERTHDLLKRECIKLHNLVRAMALKITKGKTMVVAGNYSLKEIPNQAAWTTDLEKVSLVENDIEKIPPGVSPNCPKLSTLLLQGNPLKFLPDSLFSRMHSLDILDLSRTDITGLPNTLSDLESLRALLLEKCRNLVYVPYLGKMKALLELNLSGTAIKEVPEGMENLIHLKRLSMRGAVLLETLPVGLLLSFPQLQCLGLPNQIEAPVDQIVRLKQLEVFDGRVKDLSGFNRFIK